MHETDRVATAFIEAFNARDDAQLHELMASEMVLEAPGGTRLEGRDAVLEWAQEWLRAFPDGRLDVSRTITSDDWVIQEYTFNGTHTETWRQPDGDIPPTGRRVEGHVADISRCEEGRLVESRLYYDQVELLSQLGLMQESARA
jgi:steroid delta-isomerase-like uncharacterized protein